MKRSRLALATIAFLAFCISFWVVVIPAGGEDDDEQPPELFVPVEADDWVDPVESAVRSRLISVDFDLLDAIDPDTVDGQPAPPVNFNLFEDVVVTVVFDHAEPRWPGEFVDPMEPIGYIWHGSIGADGEGHVVMITEPGLCAANLYVAGVGWFEVRPLGDVHVVREIDAGGGWTCGMDGGEGGSFEDPPEEGEGAGDGGSGCDDGTRIDVIVLYTSEARGLVEGDPYYSDIDLEIDLAIEFANTVIYPRSEVNTQLRLLYKAEFDHDEQLWGFLDLRNLRHPWDGETDDVHPLRDALRADLVSLVLSTGGSYAYIMKQLSPLYERSAFNVVEFGQRNEPLGVLITHECGHNMGCAHDRGALLGCTPGDECSPPNCGAGCAGCFHGVFDYSFGYIFDAGPDPTTYRTLMGALEGELIPQFSNPDVRYLGVPTGVHPNEVQCDWADNALSVNNARWMVANFRTSGGATFSTSTLASWGFYTPPPDGPSGSASISENGQIIAFVSEATNLAETDENEASDVFFYNRESGLVHLVSGPLPEEGGPTETGDFASVAPAVSANARFVAFASDAMNLIAGDLNGFRDVYVFNRAIDFDAMLGSPNPDMVRVSVSAAGDEAEGGASDAPAISAAGRFVAFESEATNLVAGDTNDDWDVFVRDRDSDENGIFDEIPGTTTFRISVAPDGSQVSGASFRPSISADGRFIAFASDADDIVPNEGDTNESTDVFVHDRDTDEDGIFDEDGETTTFRVSVATDGTEADGASFGASISADGRFIAFASDADDIVPNEGDTNDCTDVFVHDRDSDEDGIFDEDGETTTFRVSVATDGSQVTGASFDPSISADGQFIAFTSAAEDIVPNGGDTNEFRDVFVHELETGETIRVSIGLLGVEGNGPSRLPAISGDGRYIAFQSYASNLVPGDTNGVTDVFFHDRGPMLLGDLNGDGAVNEIDRSILGQNWGDCACCAADLDGDDDVDADDRSILMDNWTG